MNKKILVHVYSPAAATTHDMWVPLNINVNSAAIMIAKAVSTLPIVISITQGFTSIPKAKS